MDRDELDIPVHGYKQANPKVLTNNKKEISTGKPTIPGYAQNQNRDLGSRDMPIRENLPSPFSFKSETRKPKSPSPTGSCVCVKSPERTKHGSQSAEQRPKSRPFHDPGLKTHDSEPMKSLTCLPGAGLAQHELGIQL